MSARTLLAVAAMLALGAAPGRAQEPQSKPEPQPAASPAPRRASQPVNIKIDVALSDQRASEAPTRRTLGLIVADGALGRVRTQSDVVAVSGGVQLNIDAQPEILPTGKIRLAFNIQYDGPGPAEALKEPTRGTVVKTSMQQSLSLILDDGKPIVAAQSADPIGDRRVTVEVTATILRE
jgi:hypothetical protein